MQVQDAEYYIVQSTSSAINATLNIDINKKFTHCALSSCSIDKTFYGLPVDSILTITENGVNTNITFVKGNYSYKSFMAVFNAAVIPPTTSWTYAVTYPDIRLSNDTGKFSFSVSGNGGLQPSFLVSSSVHLAKMFGLNLGVSTAFSGSALNSTNVINFQSHDALIVRSSLVNNREKILAEIFSTGNMYYSSILWQNSNFELNSKEITALNSNSITFNITPFDGDNLEMNGGQITLCIVLFRKNPVDEIIKRWILGQVIQKKISLLDE